MGVLLRPNPSAPNRSSGLNRVVPVKESKRRRKIKIRERIKSKMKRKRRMKSRIARTAAVSAGS
jgi:hypothetical protein